MIRLLIRAAIFVVSAALGLLVAAWVLDGFSISASGLLVSAVVFALAQSILSPFVLKMTNRYAPALMGGFGLVSTIVALAVATLVSGGLRISGVSAWVLGGLIVWLVSALGGWLLPLVLLKKRLAATE
ncbi:MAG: phage holin family protein [Intrasporangium sp.]|uniref:phage holin family protein n=1 Tax=Intrasporangium sp. TaxID=1925024 RepID=UPI00264997CF|nr:phage holin family protein [Intrasporangium sp.]MDN5796141.1 phage holin family protein [Intrasporangium sp.]